MVDSNTSSPRQTGSISWWNVIGPGAVIASLSIGAGELVFSTRGGSLFGPRLLGPIFLICLFKWSLVWLTARHIVLSGAHPVQRWSELPGPRGWLPVTFLMLAFISFPIWVGFHAGTVGSLLSWLSGTKGMLRGADHYAWGLAVLFLIMILIWTGGYARLERLQLILVGALLVCVFLSLAMLRPNLSDIVVGAFDIQHWRYPKWIDRYPEFSQRPIWVELATYVGVVGGSGYDYLAYISYLREKKWGSAAGPVLREPELLAISESPRHVVRGWLVAPRIDSSFSFIVVFVFSAAFLICGWLVLSPQQVIPTGSDLLTPQAEFAAAGRTWLQPIYFAGAFLAMFGTLYGTIEVAPTVAQELWSAIFQRSINSRLLRQGVIAWVGLGGALVIIVSLLRFLASDTKDPPELIALLTPANFFTGVLACGLIGLLALWSDFRFLPPALRPAFPLILLNAIGGSGFLILGVKAYWDRGGVMMLGVLAATVAIGWLVAWRLECYTTKRSMVARIAEKTP